jgi:hypothetical protein
VIIDDVKNSLASLKSEISEETRVKSKDDLHVGDILSIEMDEKDGFIKVLGLVRKYEGIDKHLKVKYGIIPKK